MLDFHFHAFVVKGYVLPSVFVARGVWPMIPPLSCGFALCTAKHKNTGEYGNRFRRLSREDSVDRLNFYPPEPLDGNAVSQTRQDCHGYLPVPAYSVRTLCTL